MGSYVGVCANDSQWVKNVACKSTNAISLTKFEANEAWKFYVVSFCLDWLWLPQLTFFVEFIFYPSSMQNLQTLLIFNMWESSLQKPKKKNHWEFCIFWKYSGRATEGCCFNLFQSDSSLLTVHYRTCRSYYSCKLECWQLFPDSIKTVWCPTAFRFHMLFGYFIYIYIKFLLLLI